MASFSDQMFRISSVKTEGDTTSSGEYSDSRVSTNVALALLELTLLCEGRGLSFPLSLSPFNKRSKKVLQLVACEPGTCNVPMSQARLIKFSESW